MKLPRMAYLFILLILALSALLLPGAVLAQDGSDNVTPPEEPAPTPTLPPDSITLTTEFPELEAEATGSFVFNVKMAYKGQIARVFDLDTTVPSGWSAYVSPQYETTRIASISIDASPLMPATKSVKITAGPPSWPLADPGEYKITFKTTSGNVTGEIEFTAKITARYALETVPTGQRYNTEAKAGEETIFSIIVGNTGTAPIENVTFSSGKPSGWEITTSPEKIDILDVTTPQTVEISIKPPDDTIAGDYMITLSVSGRQAPADSMDIRVTVATPSVWGWVGVAIIIVVALGLVFVFMRFGRR